MRTSVAVLTLLLSASIGSTSWAIIPASPPDEFVAESPVIVVARWDKSPLRFHRHVEGNLVKNWETQTELVVERVVRGDLKPGKHAIILVDNFGWGEDGGPISTYTSYRMNGDVEDVAKPNLWFLYPGNSWDKEDTRDYLLVMNHRYVQPLELEPFYVALFSKTIDADVPKLIKSGHAETIKRVLLYVGAGEEPWPYDRGHSSPRDMYERQWRYRRQHTEEVRKLLLHRNVQIRSLAAAVYGAIDPDAAEVLRPLLKDPEAEVRIVAAGCLVRLRDDASLPAIVSTDLRSPNGYYSHRLIQEIDVWNKLEFVPMLIDHLDDGDRIGSCAKQAQKSLERLTGCWLPFDAKAARAAWREVEKLDDYEGRRKRLIELLGGGAIPLEAVVIQSDYGRVIQVRNISKRPISITRAPSHVQARWEAGASLHATQEPQRAEDFVSLAPGKSLRLEIEADLMGGDGKPHPVTQVSYTQLGTKFGIQSGWIGDLPIKAVRVVAHEIHLMAEINVAGNQRVIVVSNVSNRPVAISGSPAKITAAWDQGEKSEEFGAPERAADFETLAPQESLWLKVKADLIGADGQSHAVTQLLYDNPGVAFGIKDGWKGIVPVRGE